MSKSVLLSIRPKRCELIACGKKTLEVRKARPKIETPFKCYIYCTKDSYKEKFLHTSNKHGELLFWGNPDDAMITVQPEDYKYRAYTCRGKVIGEFVCDKIDKYTAEFVDDNDKPFYGWHISDLVIYDKPKELSEFRIEDKMAIRQCNSRFHYGQPQSVTQHGGWIKGGFGCMKSGEPEWCKNCLTKPLTRSPQSWCYIC